MTQLHVPSDIVFRTARAFPSVHQDGYWGVKVALADLNNGGGILLDRDGVPQEITLNADNEEQAKRLCAAIKERELKEQDAALN